MNVIGAQLGMTEFAVGSSDQPDAIAKDGTIVVGSQDDLAGVLSRAGRERRFPLIFGVDADGPMFPGSRAPENSGHFISILSYDPVSQTVTVSDQYGRASDRTNVPLSQLYASMRPRHLMGS
jgi:hypothetical protein